MKLYKDYKKEAMKGPLKAFLDDRNSNCINLNQSKQFNIQLSKNKNKLQKFSLYLSLGLG